VLDPVTFQRKFLLRKLWAKQQELVRAIRTHNQVAVKGCHGSGKTYACAGIVPYELTEFEAFANHHQSDAQRLAETRKTIRALRHAPARRVDGCNEAWSETTGRTECQR